MRLGHSVNTKSTLYDDLTCDGTHLKCILHRSALTHPPDDTATVDVVDCGRRVELLFCWADRRTGPGAGYNGPAGRAAHRQGGP